MQVPPLLKKAALCQLVGILLLACSLFCHTAIPYLITLGLGGAALMLGFLLGLFDLIRHWRHSSDWKTAVENQAPVPGPE